MPNEAIKEIPYAGLPNAYKVGIINLTAGAVCTMAAAIAGVTYAWGFAVGYPFGFVNILWLFRIVKKALNRPPERVLGYVALRYYLRFLITAGVLYVVISKGLVESPWTAVAGITVSIFAALGSMILLSREELR